MDLMNISFFIPAYNCAKTIEEAILSILETNFTSGDELIVVDDCSTDTTLEVLHNLKDNYPVLQIIGHKRNKGGAAARNTAIEHSSNELLFCLDSDNVLEKGSISKLKKYHFKMEAGATSFQNQYFFTEDKYKPDYIWKLPSGVISMEAHMNGDNVPGQHGNYLFTKESWARAGGYAEGSGALDTFTFGLRQIITGTKFVSLEGTHYYHRLDYQGSYWMRDAESNLWTVSVKAAQALTPFLHLIDEDFVKYMFGKGRYYWFYNLKKRPLKLVQQRSKESFYSNLNKKIQAFVYPKETMLKKFRRKLKL